MKKYPYLILTLFIILPLVTSAATFSFSPNTGSFETGEIFDVVISVNPAFGEEITVAKLSATFSVDQLEIVSFTPISGWMFIPTPDSDLIDNSAGKLIKMGGFPARVTASTEFGVLTLKAKSVGSAVLNIESDSLMLDITNTDKFTSSVNGLFTITTPAVGGSEEEAVIPIPEAIVVSSSDETSGTDVLPTSEEGEDTESATTTTLETSTASESESQTAAAAESGANNLWYYLGALVLLIGVFSWYKLGNLKNYSPK